MPQRENTCVSDRPETDLKVKMTIIFFFPTRNTSNEHGNKCQGPLYNSLAGKKGKKKKRLNKMFFKKKKKSKYARKVTSWVTKDSYAPYRGP